MVGLIQSLPVPGGKSQIRWRHKVQSTPILHSYTYAPVPGIETPIGLEKRWVDKTWYQNKGGTSTLRNRVLRDQGDYFVSESNKLLGKPLSGSSLITVGCYSYSV